MTLTSDDYVLGRSPEEYERLRAQARSDRWLETFARDSAGAVGHAALWPLLIGSVKCKPHTS